MTYEQAYNVAMAHRELPILIDGPHGPTGKSTLCARLRAEGLMAYEAWEIHEGEAYDFHPHAYLTVIVDVPAEDYPFCPILDKSDEGCSVRTLPDGFPPDPDRPFRKRFRRAIEDFMLDHPIAGPLVWLAVCLLIVLLTTLTLAALAAAGYIESPWR